MRPLIYSVEDDLNIQKVIKITLENSNFGIKTFENANSLFSALSQETPDLFLLDIMLPDMDGLKIIEKIKAKDNLKNIPIMIISAKASEVDKVTGLDIGADDYLVKPFGVLELISRIKALLRRYDHKADQNRKIELKGLKMNLGNYSCGYNGKLIKLTKKQFELLWYLVNNKELTLKRDEIIKNVWDYEFVGESRSLDVHINNIRKKLREAGVNRETIETVRGIGFKFEL